jgi:hypothetical protein
VPLPLEPLVLPVPLPLEPVELPPPLLDPDPPVDPVLEPDVSLLPPDAPVLDPELVPSFGAQPANTKAERENAATSD